MFKTIKLAAIALLAAPVLLLSACHDGWEEEEDYDPDFDYVNYVPSGGVSFGTFNQFEHDFSTQDIDSFADKDGFTLSLAQQSTIMISVTSGGSLDPWVDLYTGGFHFLVGDNDGGPGNNAVIVTELQAGSYVIVVGGTGDSQGMYDLDIVVGSLGGLDFGVLARHTLYTDSGGYINDPTDMESYFFTLTSDTAVDLAMIWVSGTFDGNIQLVDQYGQEVLFLDPAGLADPVVTNLNLTAGNYMLVCAAGTGYGSYIVEIDVK